MNPTILSKKILYLKHLYINFAEARFHLQLKSQMFYFPAVFSHCFAKYFTVHIKIFLIVFASLPMPIRRSAEFIILTTAESCGSLLILIYPSFGISILTDVFLKIHFSVDNFLLFHLSNQKSIHLCYPTMHLSYSYYWNSSF